MNLGNIADSVVYVRCAKTGLARPDGRKVNPDNDMEGTARALLDREGEHG